MLLRNQPNLITYVLINVQIDCSKAVHFNGFLRSESRFTIRFFFLRVYPSWKSERFKGHILSSNALSVEQPSNNIPFGSDFISSLHTSPHLQPIANNNNQFSTLHREWVIKWVHHLRETAMCGTIARPTVEHTLPRGDLVRVGRPG